MAASASRDTSGVVASGSAELAKVVSTTQRIAETIKSSATAARSLTEQAKSINEIVAVIHGIAEQTNLVLSLQLPSFLH